MSRPGQPERSATYAEVFAVAEFRWLWAALVSSMVGDQLARVALAVLVFDRTGSAGLSALTYALTLLPDVVSGPLLGGLADRFPRRQIRVGYGARHVALAEVVDVADAEAAQFDWSTEPPLSADRTGRRRPGDRDAGSLACEVLLLQVHLQSRTWFPADVARALLAENLVVRLGGLLWFAPYRVRRWPVPSPVV